MEWYQTGYLKELKDIEFQEAGDEVWSSVVEISGVFSAIPSLSEDPLVAQGHSTQQ